MKIVNLIDEDFTQYKKPSMFIGFPYCNFKCCRECGKDVCQNHTLVDTEKIDYDVNKIVSRYVNNPITKAVACGGLEPFDSWEDLLELITKLRTKTDDDIVIYTGYMENEIVDKLDVLKDFGNIIVKVGRYVPDQEEHFDDILGINLASKNQYAIKL